MENTIKKGLNLDLIVKNYSDFVEKLKTYVGKEETEQLISNLGGEEIISKASFANLDTTGLAYSGSLIATIFELTTYAIKLNNILPESKRIAIESIVKVGLLHQISKVQLFVPNDNQWEVNNRGMIYKYADLDSALRVGERSILICNNANIKFTPQEFEAMRIIDKTSDDTQAKFYSSTLSVLIESANRFVNLIHLNK